jgi:hypothetical protein
MQYDNFVMRFQCQSRQGRHFQTNWNENLLKTSNNNGIKVVNFATSKNLTVKCRMFPHCNFHKFTWMSPDGKTHMQWHSSILDIQSVRAAGYDTDHYLMVTKARETLAVNKPRLRRFHMERFSLKMLNKLEDKEHIEVSN